MAEWERVEIMVEDMLGGEEGVVLKRFGRGGTLCAQKSVWQVKSRSIVDVW